MKVHFVITIFVFYLPRKSDVTVERSPLVKSEEKEKNRIYSEFWNGGASHASVLDSCT